MVYGLRTDLTVALCQSLEHPGGWIYAVLAPPPLVHCLTFGGGGAASLSPDPLSEPKLSRGPFTHCSCLQWEVSGSGSGCEFRHEAELKKMEGAAKTHLLQWSQPMGGHGGKPSPPHHGFGFADSLFLSLQAELGAGAFVSVTGAFS